MLLKKIPKNFKEVNVYFGSIKTRIQPITIKSGQWGLEALIRVRKERTLNAHISSLFIQSRTLVHVKDVLHNLGLFSNHNECNLETPSQICREEYRISWQF